MAPSEGRVARGPHVKLVMSEIRSSLEVTAAGPQDFRGQEEQDDVAQLWQNVSEF